MFTNVILEVVVQPLVDGFSGGFQAKYDTAQKAREAWELALTDPGNRHHRKVPADAVRRQALRWLGIEVEPEMLRGDEGKQGGRGGTVVLPVELGTEDTG